MRTVTRFLPIVIVLGIIGAIVYAVVNYLAPGRQMHLTAYFPRTVGIYVGNDVDVLGVKIGTITGLKAEGTNVRVQMTYDAKYKIPAGAGAAIVPPTIVSDRYVQLIPAYSSGPTLPDHATIPQSRTEVPLELDQIFSNLNTLNTALGPQGANKNGALSRLLAVSAQNLAGNGTKLHDTLNGFGQALSTLAENRNNLFGTLANLQAFTTTLAQDNGGVVAVNNDLAQVSVQLNGERSDLAAALHDLGVALGQVQSFVGDNRAELTSDISGLGSITGTLVKEKTSLTEFLDDAPLALQNLALAGDAKYHTLDTRSNESSGSNGNTLVCQIFYALGMKTCPLSPSTGLPVTSPSALLSGRAALDKLLGVSP